MLSGYFLPGSRIDFAFDITTRYTQQRNIKGNLLRKLLSLLLEKINAKL